ncbi:hypothetical protein [uncultured Stenotrophomonas sp.]|uniref:hypothetical protein n=1 Tax=uncultured Stenotrophomonas sp. TaxID=165438 RepID=UPI0025D89E88|nr:hypothetical protein [uncultured Stenotrophomonas sp.]
MNSLDDRASQVLGASVWESNSFKGHVTYSTPAGGSNIIYFEKECGEKAKDKAASESTGSTGGGGGVNLLGGCYGNCGNVTVGDLQQA